MIPQAASAVVDTIARLLRAVPLPFEVYGLILKVVRNVVSSSDPVSAAARAVIASGSKAASNVAIDTALKAKAKLEK